MIISGYQGIGKSTLAGVDKFIDLESGNMWVNGNRSADWYIIYCQIAEHLSSQGYNVFVSSHKLVRDYLAKHSTQKLVVVFPDMNLKDKWIDKLEQRYINTGKDKDYKAWKNAECCYCENIKDLYEQDNFTHLTITDMDYCLRGILSTIDK